MIGISALLGERLRERATGEPYESGIVPTGSRACASRRSSTWWRSSS
jgi:NADH:ubiquinone oxidoreductase subunit 3 (subunit A)